jgi:hypothetical protein
MKFELPPRMRSLPVHEGWPVPFFVARINGVPDLRVADPRKGKICGMRRVCWVCGKPLANVITFIGGPLSCKNLTFSDGPMHEECSTFALQVCPYLAVTSRDRRDDDIQDRLAPSLSATTEKPEKFGHLFCSGFTMQDDKTGGWLFNPVKSAVIKIDWWNKGEILPR